MRSFDWKVGLPFALALAATVAIPQDAFAQFFFRPFANIFRTRIPDEGPPAFASRRAVAAILGRTGYQLAGPLGHRGDQIVATGFSRREGEMRFIIDPYAGRILRAVRLGPPPMIGADPQAPGAVGAPGSAGSGPAARGLDNARHPETARAPLDAAPNQQIQQRPSAVKGGTSSKSSRAIAPPPAAPAVTQKASEPSAGPAAQADKSSSDSPAPAKASQDSPADAKNLPPSPVTAETSANPGVAAPAANAAKEAADKPASSSMRVSSGVGRIGGGERRRSVTSSARVESKRPKAPLRRRFPLPLRRLLIRGAAPQAQSPTKPAVSAERSAPAKRAAAARAAGLSRRAIVPPHAPSGTTVVTPAASPPAAAGANGSATAKTPDDAGKPNAGG